MRRLEKQVFRLWGECNPDRNHETGALAMAQLEELETECKRPPEPLDDADEINADILDAISLLTKCVRLLDYVGDTDLCKSVTKRERESMVRLSESVKEYLDNVEHVYEE